MPLKFSKRLVASQAFSETDIIMRILWAFILSSVLLQYLVAFALKRLKPVSENFDKDSAVFLFDLDGTLYSQEDAARSNHNQILSELLQARKGIPLSEAEAELKSIREEYHRVPELGIILKEGTNWKDLEKWMHERLNLYENLKSDEKLKKVLAHMTIPNLHAETVLKRLGILESFDGIIYQDYSLGMNITKFDPQAYQQAMELVGQRNPTKIFFVDDILEYAVQAVKAGWNVIHKDGIGSREKPKGSNVSSVSSLIELRVLLPDLFNYET